MLSIIWPAWVSLNLDMPSVTIFTAPYSEENRHSHQLLCRAAMLLTGRDPGSIARGPWGKPCFPNLPMLHFSISHSGEWWLCAFSDRPVGIDLQRCVSFVSPKTLSRRFFTRRRILFCYRTATSIFMTFGPRRRAGSNSPDGAFTTNRKVSPWWLRMAAFRRQRAHNCSISLFGMDTASASAPR